VNWIDRALNAEAQLATAMEERDLAQAHYAGLQRDLAEANDVIGCLTALASQLAPYEARTKKLEAVLRPFTFPDHPEKFTSAEGGCTEVIIADEQVQIARATLGEKP